MTAYRYTAALKLAAVQRVIRDGQRVCDVAREFNVSEGSLFFWVRRYRDLRASQRTRLTPVGAKGASASFDADPVSADPLAGTLVAMLRRSSG